MNEFSKSYVCVVRTDRRDTTFRALTIASCSKRCTPCNTAAQWSAFSYSSESMKATQYAWGPCNCRISFREIVGATGCQCCQSWECVVIKNEKKKRRWGKKSRWVGGSREKAKSKKNAHTKTPETT